MSPYRVEVRRGYAPEGAGRFARRPKPPQTLPITETKCKRRLGADVQNAVNGAIKNAALSRMSSLKVI